MQPGKLALLLDGVPVRAAATDSGLSEGAANVAGIDAALRDDIARGTRTVTGFSHAVRLARLVDAALASSRDGRRIRTTDWPKE